MYLTFIAYTNMGGTLTEDVFNDYEFTAETFVDWYTFNRLHCDTVYPERLTKLMYHLIQLIDAKHKALTNTTTDSDGNLLSGAIASQANDGVSISMNVLGAQDVIEATDKDIKDSINRYLSGVTNSLGRLLLYRGLYPGE